jgi:anti-sigma B factor antagonist
MLSRLDTPDRPQPSSSAFAIAQRELDRLTSVVSVEGELDLATAPRLKWVLLDALEAGCTRLVVDLSRVSFLDSTALGVLVGVKRRLDPDARLAIVCARPAVLKIFEFSGMDGAFEISPTVDEALAYTRGHAAQAS